MTTIRGLALAAALAQIDLRNFGQSAEVMPQPFARPLPRDTRPETRSAFGSTKHRRHNPPGSKLWRKAREGKL